MLYFSVVNRPAFEYIPIPLESLLLGTIAILSGILKGLGVGKVKKEFQLTKNKLKLKLASRKSQITMGLRELSGGTLTKEGK